MQTTQAIQAENLVKVYNGTVRAVDGVSFQVNRGEIFGFLGPNGAGKTRRSRCCRPAFGLPRGMRS